MMTEHTFLSDKCRIFMKLGIYWVKKQISINFERLKFYRVYDHNRTKLEISYRKISGKYKNTWKFNNIL